MQIVVWALAACVLLGHGGRARGVIDGRAGWSQIPLELDERRSSRRGVGAAGAAPQLIG